MPSLFKHAWHGSATRSDPSRAAAQGVTNFAVFSSSATAVALVLFTEDGLRAGVPAQEVTLDGALNRTGNTWHIALPGLDASLLYGDAP